MNSVTLLCGPDMFREKYESILLLGGRISGIVEVVSAFLRREAVKESADGLTDVVDGSGRDPSRAANAVAGEVVHLYRFVSAHANSD